MTTLRDEVQFSEKIKDLESHTSDLKDEILKLQDYTEIHLRDKISLERRIFDLEKQVKEIVLAITKMRDYAEITNSVPKR